MVYKLASRGYYFTTAGRTGRGTPRSAAPWTHPSCLVSHHHEHGPGKAQRKPGRRDGRRSDQRSTPPPRPHDEPLPAMNTSSELVRLSHGLMRTNPLSSRTLHPLAPSVPPTAAGAVLITDTRLRVHCQHVQREGTRSTRTTRARCARRSSGTTTMATARSGTTPTAPPRFLSRADWHRRTSTSGGFGGGQQTVDSRRQDPLDPLHQLQRVEEYPGAADCLCGKTRARRPRRRGSRASFGGRALTPTDTLAALRACDAVRPRSSPSAHLPGRCQRPVCQLSALFLSDCPAGRSGARVSSPAFGRQLGRHPPTCGRGRTAWHISAPSASRAMSTPWTCLLLAPGEGLRRHRHERARRLRPWHLHDWTTNACQCDAGWTSIDSMNTFGFITDPPARRSAGSRRRRSRRASRTPTTATGATKSGGCATCTAVARVRRARPTPSPTATTPA